MIGIGAIACEIPEARASNRDLMSRFGVDENFLVQKIGVLERAIMPIDSKTSDLCIAAAQRLFATGIVRPRDVQCVVVVTQNPDGSGLPHTSAIVHGALGLDLHCSTFDISLGCSGYVHALSIVGSFMAANELTSGLLFTADPYSKVVDPADRDTAMLFGDAGTVTLLTADPIWKIGKFDFGTSGERHDMLQVDASHVLRMNGRGVFTFCATEVPQSIHRVLQRNELNLDGVDRIVLHQGSKYIVDTIGNRLNAHGKTSFYATRYGNCVSSSIPLILAQNLGPSDRCVVISGFGVGLTWASTVLTRQ
ncbi:MAG: ketoacyl-ACP synthase III [Dongiaceae bacterium]